jgi:hypothetical protein
MSWVSSSSEEALPFALALISNTLPFRATAIALGSYPDSSDADALAVLMEDSLCPLCENGLDDLSHMLFCSSIPSPPSHLRSALHFLKRYSRSAPQRLIGANLIGIFDDETRDWVSQVVGHSPDCLGKNIFHLWYFFWYHRRKNLPTDFSPFPPIRRR